MELIVNVSVPGFIDGWIDFNGNNQFDSSDRVFNNRAVVAGDNAFTVAGGNAINVPLSAVSRDTYARFRFHTASGALTPTGAGGEGEVEDYILNITPKFPWQNPDPRPNGNLDVNADGFITTEDALILISYLRNNDGGGALPVPPTSTFFPPPYYDVNGDNNATNADALAVIAFLRDTGGGGPLRTSGDGEGEGERIVPSLAPEASSDTGVSAGARLAPGSSSSAASDDEEEEAAAAAIAAASSPAYDPPATPRPRSDKGGFDDYSVGLAPSSGVGLEVGVDIDDDFASDIAAGWLQAEEPIRRRKK
jgi:hypothetical protein